MSRDRNDVYLHAWTGNAEKGIKFASGCYPGAKVTVLFHQELRKAGWKGQIRAFARLKGRAVIFYFRSLADIREPELLVWVHLLHGCRETVLADEAGNATVVRLKDCVRHLPKLIIGLAADLAVFAVTWLLFNKLRKTVKGAVPRSTGEGSPDIVYIYPYPLNREFSGGAVTHFKGFLQGVAETEETCQVLSGCKLPFVLPFPVEQIPLRRKWFVFTESLMLSYNWQFVRDARKLLAGKRPRVIYQRHGRFVISGVLLARALGIPFVLEYNGSEVWISAHWDPARFALWLRMAEEIALWGASTIVVVSEALKTELTTRGLPPERILVNPNGVDPSQFRPECGGRDKLRQGFGFEPHHVVVAFLGTFSYWHGVEVLQEAIRKLLGGCSSDHVADNLRFFDGWRWPASPRDASCLAGLRKAGACGLRGQNSTR